MNPTSPELHPSLKKYEGMSSMESDKAPNLEERKYQPDTRVQRESSMLMAGLKGTADIKQLGVWTENVGTAKENFGKFETTVAERAVNSTLEKIVTNPNKSKFEALYSPEISNAHERTKDSINELKTISAASFETQADFDSILEVQKGLIDKLEPENKQVVLENSFRKSDTLIDALTSRGDKFEDAEIPALELDLARLNSMRENILEQMGVSYEEAKKMAA